MFYQSLTRSTSTIARISLVTFLGAAAAGCVSDSGSMENAYRPILPARQPSTLRSSAIEPEISAAGVIRAVENAVHATKLRRDHRRAMSFQAAW